MDPEGGPPPTPGVSFTGTTGVTLLPLSARTAGNGGLESLLTFGSTRVGEQSETQSVVLVNSGLVPLNFYYTDTVGDDFGVTGTCPETLAPQASCTIFVTFAPTSAALVGSPIHIYHDDPLLQGDDYHHFVALTGYGDSSAVTLSDSTLDFGCESVSTSDFPGAAGSPQQVIQVTNSSLGSSVTLSNVSVSNNPATGQPDFTADPSFACDFSCPSSICEIYVTAHPRLLGPTSATLTITDTDNNLHFVVLRAVGSTPQALPSITPPYALLDPSNTTFAPQDLGTISPPSPQFSGTGHFLLPSADSPSTRIRIASRSISPPSS